MVGEVDFFSALLRLSKFTSPLGPIRASDFHRKGDP